VCSNYDSFANKLNLDCFFIFWIQVLFEVWMLSETQNKTLWQSLADLAKNWITIPTIFQWNAMCYGLTRATLYRLFGPEYGTPNILIDLTSYTLHPFSRTFLIESQFSRIDFSSFYRLLTLLPMFSFYDVGTLVMKFAKYPMILYAFFLILYYSSLAFSYFCFWNREVTRMKISLLFFFLC
jgi:hypothetical protein